MNLPAAVLDKVKELAANISYGTITITISERGTYVKVSTQVDYRVPLDSTAK